MGRYWRKQREEIQYIFKHEAPPVNIQILERALESDEDGQSQENYPSTDGYNTSHQLDGKATQKKSPWTQTEIRAVERHLMKFISSCMVPGKWECESLMVCVCWHSVGGELSLKGFFGLILISSEA
ncbi:unnamed protein product [Menidia menidia]|uniref:(Atlantic silverside) hypothetical protein n=1 Tax=Menidia menidia TaxID=238744 RepID=A0A8S4AZ18_9TELE|nr:unnamed protein product [Menidia menidia]